MQGSGNTSQNNNTSVKELAVTGISQQNKDNGMRQIVPVNTAQQIQTTNKFAVLQEEEESNAGSQVAIVEEFEVQNTPIQKKLNPAAAGFTPKSTGVASSNRGKEVNLKEAGNLAKVPTERGKESTAQWVNRTFPLPNVTTNHSCQEFPSQSLDASVIPEQECLKDRVNFVGGRLWDDQHEEETDEGEFLEGHEDVEEIQEKDPDVEQQRVNAKSGRIEVQSADEGNNVMVPADQPLQSEQQTTPKSPTNPAVQLFQPVAHTEDTGDPGGSEGVELSQSRRVTEEE
ncbi:hypothetical protein A4A49_26628 [Nicotiana attenuata]|uniref:Uncharacterized protein n=1 Tax=Nicotiana attenuata TaxID=49451 RepID=A0A1J6L3K3_NICAT|nr:hypothetical protein A4A49_26628 [Nicotiana attenuata]